MMVPTKGTCERKNAFAISPPMNINSAHVAPCASKSIRRCWTFPRPRKEPRASRNPGFLSRCLIFGSHQAAGVRGIGVPPDLPTSVERDQPSGSCAAATRSFHGARWELETTVPAKGKQSNGKREQGGRGPAAFGHYVPRCGIGLWSSTRTSAPTAHLPSSARSRWSTACRTVRLLIRTNAFKVSLVSGSAS